MSQKSFQKQSEGDAMQELKRRYFEEHGEEMSDTEVEDVRFIAQTLAEIAYQSWIGEKKNLKESKKTIPRAP
ncbi:MAG: hypothetical protein NTW11_01505 [Candidatus Staskawiczbacteria bacterium]|nr:hypothetical protein [Candidatus Staskawiczbacteria bacterium]